MTYATSRRTWIIHALAAAATSSFLIAEPAPAQTTGSANAIWEEVAVPQAEMADFAAPDGPRNFRTYDLDPEALDAILDRVPPARLAAPEAPAVWEVPLPMPRGKPPQTFRVRASPVLAPDLEARYPQIRTFEGRQVDDPAVTVRFDRSPEGVTGRIFFPDSTEDLPSDDVIIAATEDASIHTSAFLSDYTPPRHQCLVEDDAAVAPESFDAPPPLSSGRELRTYRLAIAATGEFTNGRTVESVLLRIARTVNTLNEIYEREVGIRFQLVAGNDQLIFTDGRTDPFDNDDMDALLQQSQTTLDCFIGDENYDVGHTFSAGDGRGLANLNVAGVSRQKGTGATSASPQGQTVFDVDYVAHELGHQFGATHTYNGSAGGCSSEHRSDATAYEPGSGSTIMGYAGVCDVDNLQPSSDAYFHSASLVQIREHVENGPGSHPPPVRTGNEPPKVDAGDPPYVIPKGTPFTLTAAGKDPDGDALTYCWEELDLGSQRRLVDPDDGQSPLVRSLPPFPSPSRTFPRTAGHPALSWTSGEQPPNLSRVMRFRVTARDDHRGGGGVASDETTITVHEGAGPFAITAPGAGTQQAGVLYLEWEVAGTRDPPVSVDLVNLHVLPEDGSSAIPILVDTSNDGQELVALPFALNATGRLKIESVGNVFFAVSEGDVAVVPARATVFVVRHAEKGEGDDPPLTSEGAERAETLADLLASSQIGQVHSTRTRRARQTAGPTADTFQVEVREYSAIDELFAAGGIENGRHLVVGHSDTVPEILRRLGVDNVRIGEHEFDLLFVVSLTDHGAVPQRFRYGRDGLRRDDK